MKNFTGQIFRLVHFVVKNFTNQIYNTFTITFSWLTYFTSTFYNGFDSQPKLILEKDNSPQIVVQSTMLSIENYPYEFDESPKSLGAIGLIVLASDHVMEDEFRSIYKIPGISLYHNRIKNDVKVTRETLAAMEGKIADTAGMILPGMPLDVLAFGCTSASMVIGPSRIKEICQKVIPGVKVTNPFTAAIFALKSLNASPIALVTPYRNDLNLQMKSYFENEGIEVKAMISFNEEDDNNVGRISQDSIEKAALEIGQNPEVNGIFISCTNLRFVKRVEALEKKLGKTVTSSNHALAWHALYLAGVGIPNAGWGRLYQNTPPESNQTNN